MRALRDFNTPKIVTDDVPIFMGLITDLFPALDVPRKRDLDFEKELRNGALALKLQPEEGFILKVVQLQELFEVSLVVSWNKMNDYLLAFIGYDISVVLKKHNSVKSMKDLTTLV